MATPGVLYLVRHGESLGNVNPALRRRDDPPLTDRGLGQATRAAEALASIGIDAVYSSPLRRARETAEAIGAAAGLHVQVVAELAEVNMGSLSDPESPAGRAEREATFSAWLAGDPSRGFPGGEDFPAVAERVRAGLRRVAAAAPGARVVIVTHRIPIAAAVSLCDPAASGAFGACANGSITTLQVVDGDRWRLVSWGEAPLRALCSGVVDERAARSMETGEDMPSARAGLTKDQLEALRRKLEEERSRIARVLQVPTSTLPSEDERIEFEETAQRATERAQQLEIVERERALLGEVERALAKFGTGTYGISEETGAPIPYQRLMAIPWARQGVDE